MSTVRIKTTVRDGREESLSLDEQSFQMANHPTALSTEDFYHNTKKIEDVYYKEMEQLIKEKTGAAKVVVFNHQVRNQAKANASRDVGPYAASIHSDASAYQAESLFRSAISGQLGNAPKESMEPFRKGRFVFMNAWRNISEQPVQNHNLAVCDATSLVGGTDDAVPYDVYQPLFKSVGMFLAPRHALFHRWYYYSNLKKDEVVLFKQYDSDHSKSGRVCFHTSFSDPSAPPDTPDRESVEVRAMAFFPDHTPNTCPEFSDPNEEVASNLIQAVLYIQMWPFMGRIWFAGKSKTKAGREEILEELLKDKTGRIGCQDATEKEKILMKEAAIEQGFYTYVAQAAASLEKSGGWMVRFLSRLF